MAKPSVAQTTDPKAAAAAAKQIKADIKSAEGELKKVVAEIAGHAKTYNDAIKTLLADLGKAVGEAGKLAGTKERTAAVVAANKVYTDAVKTLNTQFVEATKPLEADVKNRSKALDKLKTQLPE